MAAAPNGERQLSVSGSRSLLKQLKPRVARKGLLQRDEHDRSGSSTGDEHAIDTVNEEESDRDEEGSSSSFAHIHDRNTTARANQQYPFRSMLGGGSPTGVLALKDRFGRLRQHGGTQDKAGSSKRDGFPLLGRSRMLRRGNLGSRPRLQHADSLSSDEGANESSDAHTASGADMIIPTSSNEEETVSSHGGTTTSGDDNEDDNQRTGDVINRGSDAGGVHGFAKPTLRRAFGKGNPQAGQIKNNLLRLTRQRSRRIPTPRLSSSSDSSTTSVRKEGDEGYQPEIVTSPGKRATTVGSSLFGSRFGRRKQRGDSPDQINVERGERAQDKLSGWSGTTKDIGTGSVSGEGNAPPRERRQLMLPFWQLLVNNRGRPGDAGHANMVAVSGEGRPAAGRIENAMYHCFGGIVGRAWPGIGLALPPVTINDHSENQVKAHQAAREDDVIRWEGPLGCWKGNPFPAKDAPLVVLESLQHPRQERVRVIATDALPEDSRITRPMIVVHIVDSSTGRYLTRSHSLKVSSVQDTGNAGDSSGQHPGQFTGDDVDGGVGTRLRAENSNVSERKQPQQRSGRNFERDETTVEPEPAELIAGGATTTFEERTLWDLTTSGRPETGHACGTVPPAATMPWVMTMQSSTPVWEEALVFTESYRRLLAPESLVLFELVDFATALSRKQARKGGGLSKIAWAFLRPLGAGGQYNVGVRNSGHAPSSKLSFEHTGEGEMCSRTSSLQLFKYQPLSVLSRWQARHRGFPRLHPPASPEVPDAFLQFLLVKRARYPATLTVSVGPTHCPMAVRVERRPMASHEREAHQLSYEALASMHNESREDRENIEAAGILPSGASSGLGSASSSGAVAGVSAMARSRRLRAKNEPCALPDRLLHRVYAGQNGAITLAFSGSGALLAAACCDDPLPGRFPIRLIDPETGRCRVELKGHASMVYSLVWSTGDRFLLSASADGTAKVWSVPPIGDVAGGGAPASAEGLVATRKRGSKDELPPLVCVLQHAPPCFVYAAVFQPAEVMDRTRGATSDHQRSSDAGEFALAVTGAYDRRLRLWDVSAAVVAAAGGRAKMLGTLSSKTVHESHVNAIVYDSKNNRLYSGDGAGVIVVWRRSGGGQGGVESYGILRKVQHADIVGKAITSLSLAPRLRRGQLLVQAHGNTLRLLDLATYQLVNPGFAGGAAAESLIRASFSPDGRFVVSGSENGRVRVWEAQEGKRVRTPLQDLGTSCSLRDVAWHPHQHVLALAGYGQDSPVLLYCGEARIDKQNHGALEARVFTTSMEQQAAREAQASAEEHRRRLDNRQRLKELRIKRLRAKALGRADGLLATATSEGLGSSQHERGVVTALAALSNEGQTQHSSTITTPAAPS